jgi:D-3-phosphoglycerate dehydrogenase
MSLFPILRLNQIAARGLAHLPPNPFEIACDLTQPDAILQRSAHLHQCSIPASVLAVRVLQSRPQVMP